MGGKAAGAGGSWLVSDFTVTAWHKAGMHVATPPSGPKPSCATRAAATGVAARVGDATLAVPATGASHDGASTVVTAAGATTPTTRAPAALMATPARSG